MGVLILVALVLCVDEKSQVQALERTQPRIFLLDTQRNAHRMPTEGATRPNGLVAGGGCGSDHSPVVARGPHRCEESHDHSDHDDGPKHEFMALGPSVYGRQ
jgi:hypothetical protein